MRSRWGLLLAGFVAAAAACGRSGALDPDSPGTPTPTPTASAPFCDPANVSLLGCWRFDGDLDDESANALVFSAGSIEFASGAIGEAAVFGPASSLSLPGTALVAGSAAGFTIEAWVRLDSLPAAGARFGVVDRPTPYSVFLYPNGVLRCGLRSLVYASNAGLVPGSWFHVACVDDTQTTRAYVDGELSAFVGGADLLSTSTAGRVNFGENNPEGNDQFLGRIDEVRVFRMALDSAAVAASASRRDER